MLPPGTSQTLNQIQVRLWPYINKKAAVWPLPVSVKTALPSRKPVENKPPKQLHNDPPPPYMTCIFRGFGGEKRGSVCRNSTLTRFSNNKGGSCLPVNIMAHCSMAVVDAGDLWGCLSTLAGAGAVSGHKGSIIVANWRGDWLAKLTSATTTVNPSVCRRNRLPGDSRFLSNLCLF